MRVSNTTTTIAVAAFITAGFALTAAARAAVYGHDDFGYIVILEDLASGSNDHLDSFNTYNNSFAGNQVTLTGSTGQSADSITDSNTRGILYSISTAGQLWKIDWFRQTAQMIADLDPPGASDDVTYDSITNAPGSDKLYILRSGPNQGAIDTYDTVTGTYLTNQYTMSGTGEIALSDGPATSIGSVNTNGAAAVYLLATGGNFEVLDPANPGSNTALVSNGTTGPGDLVSLAPIIGNTTQMAVLQDRTGTPSTDQIHLFNVADSGRTVPLATTVHTAASSITDSPREGWVYSIATGGGVTHLQVEGGSGQDDLSAGGIRSASGFYQSAANVGASGVERFVYIADDGSANHTDLFDTQYRDNRGFYNNALSNAATTTTAGNFNDTAVTDAYDPAAGRDFIFQLHTGGELYRVDPLTGGESLLTTFAVPGGEADQIVYDAITNLPGTTKLYILRNDRNTNTKFGMTGSTLDAIDIYDFATDTYTPDVWTTVGTGAIDLTDGPGGMIYVIATGGSFEVVDPDSPGTITQLHTGIPAGENSGDDYIGITNIDGDENYLYLLRDRATSGADDVIDIYDLNGNEVDINALFLEGLGGAMSITDTYERGLFVIAAGGAANRIDVTGGPGVPTLTGHSLTLTQGSYASVTNLGTIPEPTTLALLTLAVPALLRRRRGSRRHSHAHSRAATRSRSNFLAAGEKS